MDPQAGTQEWEFTAVLLPCGSNPEGSLVSTPVKTAALGYIQFPEVLESLWSVLMTRAPLGKSLQLAGYVIRRHACVQCDRTSPRLKGPLQGATPFTRQSGKGGEFSLYLVSTLDNLQMRIN